jgi:hypothetical protein
MQDPSDTGKRRIYRFHAAHLLSVVDYHCWWSLYLGRKSTVKALIERVEALTREVYATVVN